MACDDVFYMNLNILIPLALMDAPPFIVVAQSRDESLI